MARYLTPSKIGLLLLIELYAQQVIPVSSTIPVLSFILTHLLPTLPATSRIPPTAKPQTGGRSLVIDVEDFEGALTKHSAASGLPGRSLWDHLLKKLWNLDSLDALHTFFDTLSNVLAKSKDGLRADTEMDVLPPSEDAILISQTSPFGTFIRRSQLEFSRLKFHDALNLWKSFVSYRQPTWITWAAKNGLTGLPRFDAALEAAGPTWDGVGIVAYEDCFSVPGNNSVGLVSTDDVEKLLEFQVEEMQSNTS